MNNGHGGKRAGAGKPKGVRWPSTLSKLAAREKVRQMVTQAMQPMLMAQIAHAQGIGHIFTRDKGGKFSRIEDMDEIERLLTQGTEGEHYWIFSKDPSAQAFSDLMNRALDKPKEQEQDVKVTGTLKVIWDDGD